MSDRPTAASLVAIVVVLLGAVTVLAPRALADHKVCNTLPDGTTYCYVVHDPPPGRGGGTNGGGHSSCQNKGVTIPCYIAGDGFWDSAHLCYASVMDPPPAFGDPLWEGHTSGSLYRCAGGQGAGFFWSATSPPGLGPTPLQLAQQAFTSVKAPRPTTGRYPSGTLQNGQSYTVVHAYTWYYSDPAEFTTLTARASAGPVWAQVTVTPAALTFTPGDGHGAVSCTGPGTAWNSKYGVWAASPSGCD